MNNDSLIDFSGLESSDNHDQENNDIEVGLTEHDMNILNETANTQKPDNSYLFHSQSQSTFRSEEESFNDGTMFEDIETITTSQIDLFLINLYKYFVRRGFRNIVVSQILNLASVTFLVLFCIFLFSCVDFQKISNMRDPGQEYHLSDAIDWSGMSHMHWYLVICLILYIAFFIWRSLRIVYDIYKMKEMKLFYNEHLGITDFELATIRWQKVLEKLTDLRAETGFYLGKDDFSAHNVANRILKKDNYMIAMFNKDVFNFDIPYLDKWYKLPIFTKGMELNIQYCIMNFMFDERMKLKPSFKEYSRREELATDLRKRVRVMGALNIVLMPFLFLFMLFYGLFKYGQDIYKNPSTLSHREWTLLAEWKFREFNELPHVFYERMKLSAKYADEYLEQFPNYWLSNVAKFVSFVSGAFLFILLAMTFSNDHVLFNLEITSQKTVFWYTTILTTIFIISRSLIKENYIFYPEKKLKKVAEYIHYIPEDWIEVASHSSVKLRFTRLYQYRGFILLMELFGLIINPVLMFFRLQNSCYEIVDFVREYTQANQKLGNVCQFAVFEMENQEEYQNPRNQQDVMSSNRLEKLNEDCKEDKLQKSIYHFKQTYDAGNELIEIPKHSETSTKPLVTSNILESFINSQQQSGFVMIPNTQSTNDVNNDESMFGPPQPQSNADLPHPSTFTSEMLINDIDEQKRKEKAKKANTNPTLYDIMKQTTKKKI